MEGGRVNAHWSRFKAAFIVWTAWTSATRPWGAFQVFTFGGVNKWHANSQKGAAGAWTHVHYICESKARRNFRNNSNKIIMMKKKSPWRSEGHTGLLKRTCFTTLREVRRYKRLEGCRAEEADSGFTLHRWRRALKSRGHRKCSVQENRIDIMTVLLIISIDNIWTRSESVGFGSFSLWLLLLSLAVEVVVITIGLADGWLHSA